MFDDPLLGLQQFGRAETPFVTGTGEETPVPTSHHPTILLDASVPHPATGSLDDDVGYIHHSCGGDAHKRHDLAVVEKRFGEGLDLVSGAALRERGGDLPDHVG